MVVAIGSVVLGITAIATLAYFATTLPPISSAGESPDPSLILEARNGEVFGYRGILDSPHVTADAMPHHLRKAVIAIEDRRFYDHFGVDFRAIGRAAIRNIQHWEIREGGSTITQQLAKIEYLTSDKSLARKIQEALIAVRLERRHTKKQIFETYLNKVYFGAGAYGITAAAQRYFDKPVGALTLPESAMLAGLIRSPSRLAPTSNISGARMRARLVLKAMEESGFITAAKRKHADADVRVLTPTVGATSGEGFFADWIQSETRRALGPTFGGFTVRTTLDPGLQAIAERIVEKRLSKDGAALNMKQAALVAMAPDGAVLAMVGGRDYNASQFNRAAQSLRQPGSLFKLFVYQTALEKGYSTRSVLVDRPVKFGKWAPRNFKERYRGPMTLEKAFARSTNSIAAQLGDRVGPDAIVAAARKMGIRSPLDPQPSLALGTSETTLLEITGSYASVLRGTTGIDPYGIQEIRSGDAILYNRSIQPSDKARPLALRDDLLRLLRATVRIGTGRRAKIKGDEEVAGKTGTSQGYKDAWFVGFTPSLVVGVWVGNDDNAPMKRVTGGTVPAEIWREFVVAVQEYQNRPEPPAVIAEPLADPIAEPQPDPALVAETPPEPASINEPQPEKDAAQQVIADADAVPVPAETPGESGPIAEDPDSRSLFEIIKDLVADSSEAVPLSESPPPANHPPAAEKPLVDVERNTIANADTALSKPAPKPEPAVGPPAPRAHVFALVPDLAELTAKEAARLLKRRGLRYRSVGSVDSMLKRGTVSKQHPLPGQRVAANSRVFVWTTRARAVRVVKAKKSPGPVAAPRPAPRKRTMVAVVPQLTKMKFAEAAALLKSRGLRYRNAGTTASEAPQGTVTGQKPHADRRVPKGTVVAVWVARKPAVEKPRTVAHKSTTAPRARPQRRPSVVVVPNVAKLAEDDARVVLKQAGLRLRARGTIASKLPPGTIASQEPEPGRQVARNTVISVWSARQRLVEVPNVAGRSRKEAQMILTGRGLQVSAVGSVDSSLPPGSIATQNPRAGRQVPPNTVVSLWTARAAFVDVPDLRGKTADEARALVTRRGLDYRSAGTVESERPVDTVARQTPRAGERVAPGSQVAILVAKPERVVVPNIAKMIPIEARVVLRRNGLRYRMMGTVESAMPAGWITKQTPKAGQRVTKNTVVSVWAARQPLIAVPNVGALTRQEAVRLLKKRGFAYRLGGSVESDLPWGWVAKQKPAAGKRVGKDTVVSLWTATPRLVVGIPRVESTSTLWFGGRRIRLAGVRGVTGLHATSMASYIQGRRVKCRPTGGKAHRCEVDGYDLAEVVLYNGGGRATENAPRKLRAAEASARRARMGIWRLPRPPSL